MAENKLPYPVQPTSDQPGEAPPGYNTVYGQPSNPVYVGGGVPPPPGFPSIQQIPPPPPGPANIIYVMPPRFSDRPTQVVCPNCKANVLSQIKYESGVATWLIAGGICLLGAWLGCCLIPFCIDACKDVEHYCPNCRSMIGQYKRV